MEGRSTPKGMRDFLPDDMEVRNEVMDRIAKSYRSYGFMPMETPAMEYLEVLGAKSGDEIKGQIFRIADSDLGLRFDLTVPMARVVANNHFPKPFKRYCIGKVWRREEPQKGRFREFYQADADIVGCKGMRAEAELLSMAKGVLAEFGFRKPRMLLNNRKVLDGIVTKLGISDKKNAVFRALDKLDKISGREVEDMLESEVGREKMEALLEVFSAEGNRERLKTAKKYSEDGAKELEEILRLCGGIEASGIEIELAMVRGLGYYTGPIFEIKLSESMGTVVAGGRYDGLLGLYGQEDYAVGISVGIERLIALLKEKKDADGKTKCGGVFVVNVKPETYAYALNVAEEMRAGGVPAETDLNERNMRKQMDYANARGHRLMAIVGEKEASEKKVTLKDMKSGKQETVAFAEASEKAKALLG